MAEPNTRLDRFLAGDLSAAEQRQLAEEALEDPHLFDLLTAAALVKTNLVQDVGSRPPVDAMPADGAAQRPNRPLTFVARGQPGPRRRGRQVLLWASVATAAAAALAFILIQPLEYRLSGPNEPPDPSPATNTSTPSPGVVPVVPHPVILSARLYEEPTTEFRGTAESTPLPREAGTVVSIEGGEVSVDLGAVDGLEKGSIVQLSRGGDSAPAIGTLSIVRVFRQRSIGIANVGEPAVGDRVEIAPALRVTALLDQVSASLVARDVATARNLAVRAVAVAQSGGVREDLSRRALARLGTLEYTAGRLDAAERHLQTAIDRLDIPPAAAPAERTAISNVLGATLIARERYDQAESLLRRAQPQASGAEAVRLTNNLAALAAWRGDWTTARSLYLAALEMTGNAPELEFERRAIEKNLEEISVGR